MPNWCSTAYAIEGDAKEVKSLYDLMNELQKQKEPSVPNGFGTAWLGCLWGTERSVQDREGQKTTKDVYLQQVAGLRL